MGKLNNRDLLNSFGGKPISNTRRLTNKKASGTFLKSPARRRLLLGLGASSVAFIGFGAFVETDFSAQTATVPKKLRIILVDSSDKNTHVQDRLISRLIEIEALNGLGAGDRLILYGLTADQTDPLEERFNRISPTRGSEASPWKLDPAQAEAEWKATFLNPYVHEAREIREIVEKKQTPFLEALMQISLVLSRYEAEEKEVIVVSDALQHVRNGLSAYTNSKARQVTKMNPDLAGFYQPNFAGVKVRLVHILRNKQQRRQNDEHKAWLKEVLANNGASFQYTAI